MNRVERWYRVALTAYPPDYLAEREEELVTTLLAVTPAGSVRPPVRELASLVRNGVAERQRRFGATTRRQGLAAASHLALGLFAALTTFVVGPQLAPVWSAPFPRVFVPFWVAIVVATVVGHAGPQAWRRWSRITVLGVAALGLGTGPAGVLAWRSAIVGVTALALLASCRPVDVRRWPALAPVGIGIVVGVLGAHHQLGPLRGIPALPERTAFLGIVQTGSGPQLWWALATLVVTVLAAAWVMPRLALALGLNALPAAMAVLSFAAPGQNRLDKVLTGLPIAVATVACGLLAAVLATASTLRSRTRPA